MYNHLFISDVSKLARRSKAKIQIECSLKSSEKCKEIATISYDSAMSTIEANNGNYMCLYCANHTKHTGRNNPNKKYDLDDDMFKQLNREKAYLLGWIASDGCVQNGMITIKIHEKDIACLKILGNIVCDNYDIKFSKNKPFINLRISSQTISKDVCDLLQIKPGKKSDVVKFAEIDDELKWHFLRGVLDGDGHIRNIDTNSSPECHIASNSKDMLESIKEFTNIPCHINNNIISFAGVNCIDFLGKIYENCDEYKLQRKFDMYQRWIECGWQPKINGKGCWGKIQKNCIVCKTHIDAVIPFKKNNSDAGFDLTVIKESKVYNEITTLYDTGIKLSIPIGYYAEIIARSSLSKSGYILGNSVGIIDNSYRGNIYIPLTKILPNAEPIQLPFCCCQLLIKKQEFIEIEETCKEPDETSRNEGGFGSTNK